MNAEGLAPMLIEALKALLIGLVEGITEWLPISSTGHMILVDEFVKLQVSDSFLALFLVVIQIGVAARGAFGAWWSLDACLLPCSVLRSTIS